MFKYDNSIYPLISPYPIIGEKDVGNIGTMVYPYNKAIDYFIITKIAFRKYKVELFQSIDFEKKLVEWDFMGIEEFDEYLQINNIYIEWVS